MSVNPEIMKQITWQIRLVANILMVFLSITNFSLDRLDKMSTNILSIPTKHRLAAEGLALVYDIQLSLFYTLHTMFGVGEAALC